MALTLIVCSLSLLSAPASIDIFLNVDGIPGESIDSAHRDQIDVLSWSWGMSNSSTFGGGGGGGAGKVSIQDLNVTKYLDKASPALMLACSNGRHIPRVVLYVRKAGGTAPRDFLIITLEDVIIASLGTGGAAGQDRLTENVSLRFAKVKVEYWQQLPDGKYDPITPYTWNILTNTQ